MKTKAVILAALWMSIFTSGMSVVAFAVFLTDHYIYEPNKFIAFCEMVFASLLTLLAVVGFTLYLRLQKKHKAK